MHFSLSFRKEAFVIRQSFSKKKKGYLCARIQILFCVCGKDKVEGTFKGIL
jgi:hypothetical protein